MLGRFWPPGRDFVTQPMKFRVYQGAPVAYLKDLFRIGDREVDMSVENGGGGYRADEETNEFGDLGLQGGETGLESAFHPERAYVNWLAVLRGDAKAD